MEKYAAFMLKIARYAADGRWKEFYGELRLISAQVSMGGDPWLVDQLDAIVRKTRSGNPQPPSSPAHAGLLVRAVDAAARDVLLDGGTHVDMDSIGRRLDGTRTSNHGQKGEPSCR